MRTPLFVFLAGLAWATCAKAAEPTPAPSGEMQYSGQDRAAWMPKAKWGIMNHYLADWISQTSAIEMSVEKWNDLVDHFDVEALAAQVRSVGAGWYQISVGQGSGYYLSPNAAYDRITGDNPSKCSRRDLVADLYDALHKRGIKLMVYLPSHPPKGDKAAMAAFNYKVGPYRNREAQIKWEQVMSEWGARWGAKAVGWWFDGVYWPNAMYRFPDPPNFQSFALAARAGNPDRILAFNPGVTCRPISQTAEDDYLAGELDNPEIWQGRRIYDGKMDGAQVHVLTYLGRTWGKGEPRFPTAKVLEYTKKVADAGGVITWDVPVQTGGTMAEPFMEQLRAIGKELGTLPNSK